MKSLTKKLSVENYVRDKMVDFTVVTGQQQPVSIDGSAQIPIQIVNRLFHLGRAYSLPQLKMLRPEGLTSLDFTAMQVVGAEIEQLIDIVSDPALHHYGKILLGLITASQGNTKTTLVMRAP